ncbi:acyl-CoA dehydrogenase family protein [Streptomyces sp. CA-294286]|uniref:acyl-CoA dehydrogenase family protein n=1 Tax=Streptomyces sp. CA-294286 TaxID=3240070 RepID=UPI003D905A96
MSTATRPEAPDATRAVAPAVSPSAPALVPDDPDGLGPLAGARRLRDVAASHAADADRTGVLADEVVALIRDAGFARHLVPVEHGGHGGGFGELNRAVALVGEGCAATAWCASLAAYSARFVGHLPAAGQDRVRADGADALIATALVPGGRAVPESGGWRLAGQWNYVSGIRSADWVLLCAPVVPEGPREPGVPPELRFFALPRGAYTVRETWDSVGMRATGSHTVAVEGAGVLVDAELSFARQELLAGRNAHSPLPLHNLPFRSVAGLPFVVPALGAAAGALAACAATVTGRRRTETNELRLVRASAKIDAARLLVAEHAAVLDARAFSPESLARGERNVTFATELLREAVDEVVRAAGTGGLGDSSAVQRLWRDVTSATSHVALQYETFARSSYAAVLLGPKEG